MILAPLSFLVSFTSHSHSLNFRKLISGNATPQQISLDLSPLTDNPQPTNKTGVVVIGAGLAGLAAATRLQADGVPFVLLEASAAVGGRVRTDFVDGFNPRPRLPDFYDCCRRLDRVLRIAYGSGQYFILRVVYMDLDNLSF